MNRHLSEFSAAMNGTLWGEDVEFAGVSIDSRTCSHGDLFFAIRGERFDGHQYLSAAKDRGAVAAGRPASIVNIVATQAFTGGPGMAHAAAAKAAPVKSNAASATAGSAATTVASAASFTPASTAQDDGDWETF